MIRSVWKMPFIFNKRFKMLKNNRYKRIKHHKNFVITPRSINKLFHIYNGKNFIKIFINDRKMGHKWGEFVMTRRYINSYKYKRLKQLKNTRKKNK